MFFDDAAEGLVVGHTACDEDSVDIHVESCCRHAADFLGDLVSHGAIHFLPLFVAGFHLVFNFKSVVGAEICHEAALAFEHEVDIFLCVFATEAGFHQRA